MKRASKVYSINNQNRKWNNSSNANPLYNSSKAMNKKLLDAIKKEQIELIQKILFKRPNLFEKDKNGKTLLFDAVETGNLKIVEILIFSLMGTGMSLQRLTLLEIKDDKGKTAEDVAKENGFTEIEKLLMTEKGRMEFYE